MDVYNPERPAIATLAITVPASTTESEVLAWDTGFPDTNYYIAAILEGSTGPLEDLRLQGVLQKTTLTATFRVRNSGVINRSATLVAMGWKV